MQEIIITREDAGQRLDKFLFKYLNKAPHSFVYKMLRKKNIKLNGAKAEGKEILSERDGIKLFLADDTIAQFREKLEVRAPKSSAHIIYEDENILIANKPAGMLSQGDSSGAESLNDILLWHLAQNGSLTDTFKPGIANRLDRNTGGLVVMGKNLAAAQALAEAIRNNRVDKIYIAAVSGLVDKDGEISGWHTKDSDNKVLITPHKREGAVPVKTLYFPVFSSEKYSILRIKLITGRSHQIRESFAQANHPIIGDPKYGDREINAFFKKELALAHQLLYAVSLKFDIKDGILAYLSSKTFTAEPDKTAKKVLEYIQK